MSTRPDRSLRAPALGGARATGAGARERGAAGVGSVAAGGAGLATANPAPARERLARVLDSRSAIVAASTVLVAMALTLGAALSVATADRSFRDDALAPYLLPIRHLYDALQRAALHGVSIDRSAGVRRDIGRTQEVLARLAARDPSGAAGEPAIALVGPRGQVVHTWGPAMGTVSHAFVEAVSTPNEDGGAARGRHYTADGSRALLSFRIVDPDGRWAGTIIASVDATVIETRRGDLRATAIRNCVFSLAAAMLFYVLVLTLIFEAERADGRNTLKRILWISAVFALLAQVATIDVSLKPYRDAYPHTVSEKTRALSEIVLTDLAPALRRGVVLEYMDFRPFDWDNLLKLLPEADHLSVRDAHSREVVRVDAKGHVHFQNEKLQSPGPSARSLFEGTPQLSSWPLPEEHGGTVDLVVTRENVTGRMLDVAGDAFTATMVSLLMFVEALLVYHLVLGSRREGTSLATGARAAGLMRPAAFLFVFGIDLSMSFVPLHTERLYDGSRTLAPELVMGLPISAEFALVGIAILVAGPWVDRRGWKEPFVAGVVLASLGSLYSWAAPGVAHFIASRAVVGAGFGLVLMATQAYVVGRSTGSDNASGLAQLFAGIYGGTICGGVAGAVLAERIGFGPVFLIGGLVTASVLAYAAIAVLHVPQPAPTPKPAGPAPREPGRRGPLAGFVTSRGVLALVLFSSLPASIAAVGFLNYFAPVYLDRLGASQSTIGQVLMLYGICLVFVGPLVGKAMASVQRKKNAVVAGTLLGGTAFLAFNLLEGVAAVAVAVAVLGIAHSLVLSSQTSYLLALRAARDLGQGLAISLFRSTGRLGQMLGPAAFAGIALAASPTDSLGYLGYAYAGCALMFWLLLQRDRGLLAEET